MKSEILRTRADKAIIWLRAFYRNLSRSAVNMHERVKMTEHFFLLVLAIIIGILSGLGSVIIKFLIEEISIILFPGNGNLLQRIQHLPYYWIIAVPALGGLLVGIVSKYTSKEAQGHGVPEVIQAIMNRGGKIKPVVAIIKSFTSAITIGTGGSVGYEGPIVQIGASIGSTVGQFFRVSSKRLKILAGCGAAAGLAAAFNVPVAGAIFALEILLMDFGISKIAPIIISSVIATVISHFLTGNFVEFNVPSVVMVSTWEVFLWFLLGAICGLVSYIFIKHLYFTEHYFEKKIKIPKVIKPAVGGLLIGIIGVFAPNILGVGNDTMNLSINSPTIWYIMLMLAGLKIISTSFTLGSGGSGGVFAPSLFIGAMLGAFYGNVIHDVFPFSTADPGIYALIAMGGMIAGTIRAPMTAIIIVFEMTQHYDLLMPLMVTSIISLLISSKLSRESIYTLKLVQNQVKIKGHTQDNVLKSILIEELYDNEFEYIKENANFQELVKFIISKNVPEISVHSLNGDFMGVISLNSIKDLLFEKDDLKNVLIAGDIADKNVPFINISTDCFSVLNELNHREYDILPVFDELNPKIQIGVIWRKDIDEAFHKELEREELTASFAEKISKRNQQKDVQFAEGHIVTEILVPESFIGKTILQLDIRKKYGVDILSIIKSSDEGEDIKAIPSADYKFEINDILVLAGEIERVNILRDIV